MKTAKTFSMSAMNTMRKELLHILNTTDYSTYKLRIYYDDKKHTTIVPKPVFALSFAEESVRECIIAAINDHPGCNVIIK